jgi:hypothetical protein
MRPVAYPSLLPSRGVSSVELSGRKARHFCVGNAVPNDLLDIPVCDGCQPLGVEQIRCAAQGSVRSAEATGTLRIEQSLTGARSAAPPRPPAAPPCRHGAICCGLAVLWARRMSGCNSIQEVSAAATRKPDLTMFLILPGFVIRHIV